MSNHPGVNGINEHFQKPSYKGATQCDDPLRGRKKGHYSLLHGAEARLQEKSSSSTVKAESKVRPRNIRPTETSNKVWGANDERSTLAVVTKLFRQE
jgi:hypothetical protein